MPLWTVYKGVGIDMCITKPTTTIDTEYQYDENGNVTKIHSVTVVDDPTPPCITTVYDGSDDDVEYGVELDDVIEVSPWETILTAAAGAFLGNVIYHVIKKMMDK